MWKSYSWTKSKFPDIVLAPAWHCTYFCWRCVTGSVCRWSVVALWYTHCAQGYSDCLEGTHCPHLRCPQLTNWLFRRLKGLSTHHWVSVLDFVWWKCFFLSFVFSCMNWMMMKSAKSFSMTSSVSCRNGVSDFYLKRICFFPLFRILP